MDYQIASKKLISTTVILSFLYMMTIFLYRQILVSQSITLCSNGQRIVAVFRLKNDTTVLIPTKSIKDTLDCLRRGMSFYDRTIDIVLTSSISDTGLSELKSRYKIIREKEILDGELGLPIDLVGSILQINFESLYAVYLNPITDPYTFVEFIRYNNPKIIIVPELSEVIAQLLKQNSVANTTQIVDLSEGTSITLRL